MRSGQLHAAAAELDATGRALTDAGGRHGDVATAAGRIFGGIPGAWSSPESRQLTAASNDVVAAARATRTALTGASQVSSGLGGTASAAAGELQRIEEALARAEAAAAAAASSAAGLAADDTAGLAAASGAASAAASQIRTLNAQREECIRAWNEACRTAAPALGEAAAALRQVAGSPSTLPPRRSPSRVLYQWLLEPAWPFAAGLTALERTFRATVIALSSLKAVADDLSNRATQIVTRTRTVQRAHWRSGHWRRTPSGGRTWVKPHLVRQGAPFTITDSSRIPNALLRARAANVATWAQRGGTVVAFGGAAYGEFNDVKDDRTLETSEKAGRIASATVFEGGGSVAGAVAGAKGGALAGAAIGSIFPGPGTVIGGGVGAVVGGVVGSSVGNKVGSFVHDRVGPAIGGAAKGAVDTVKKLKFW